MGGLDNLLSYEFSVITLDCQAKSEVRSAMGGRSFGPRVGCPRMIEGGSGFRPGIDFHFWSTLLHRPSDCTALKNAVTCGPRSGYTCGPAIQ